MNPFKNREELLDAAIVQAADEPLDPRQVEEAASRVWARLSQMPAEANAPAEAPAAASAPAHVPHPSTGSLHGCDDFRALIPAYVRRELPSARALLVEDHTRTCVPCRRALIEAREGKRREDAIPLPKPRQRDPRIRLMGMSLAAALAVALGLGVILMIQDFLAGGPKMARVEAIEGTLYKLGPDSGVRLSAGDPIGEGDEIRTAKGSTALVKMTDGTVIEMGERAGFALDGARKGNTIELDRGRVIVHAAKQHQRHLFVSTPDALVSVTGTIFAVNSGIKGSRVSVVEGEVHVAQAKRESILHAGDQVTTHPSVQRVPVKDEIAWSRNAKEYEALLAELTAAGKDIDARVGWPGLRTSTRLLDLAPAGTVIYIALPNLSRNLTETQRILDEKIAESPSLARWWNESLAGNQGDEKFRQILQEIGDLGHDLGDEVAVALSVAPGEHREPDSPILMAEIANQATFHATLEAEVAKINERAHKTVAFIVDDLDAAPEGDGILFWVHDGLFVASPKLAALRQVAATAAGAANPFTQSTFYTRVGQEYHDGAGWVFAADLSNLIGAARSKHAAAGSQGHGDQTAEALGVYDMQHFIIDRRDIDGRSETRAALTFNRERRGMASWLSAPAPMGGLSFFSPDANLVAGFTVKSPVSILDELMSVNPQMAQELAEVQAKAGFDLRQDLLAPLGGEIAFGVDGPVLPQPSWKLVAEVYDPAHLEATFEKAVGRLNDELRQNGKPQVVLSHESSGGQTFYALNCQGEAKLLEVHYVFADGYMVAAPSRALLETALQQRAAGVTIASSPKFRDLLGPDGQVNVSAVVYQNLAPLVNSAKKLIPSSMQKAGPRHGPNLGALLTLQGPTLYYAYAEPDRIVFAGSNQNPLGMNLSTLASLKGILSAAGGGLDNQVQ